MKSIFIGFIIICIVAFTIPKGTLLEKLSIGKFSYSIYKQTKYLHEGNVQADFFVVYYSDNKPASISAYLTAKRNDTLLIKGNYRYNQKRLEFREYYFNNKSDPDSVIKTYYPNKSGKLLAIEYIEFKNGIATKTKY